MDNVSRIVAMPESRTPPPRRPSRRSAETRARIVAVVRAMLEDGSFHDSPVEAVAERAGISRATLYLHFASRSELVSGMCDDLGVNPALVAVRQSVRFEDAEEAVTATIANTVRFWASEEALLDRLYGAWAVDPAAGAFVERQRADRRSEIAQLARSLHRSGRLQPGVEERGALARLLMLTSFETFQELRRAGLSEREVLHVLRGAARQLLSRADGERATPA
jgi:AcrR family transcriptional regulator